MRLRFWVGVTDNQWFSFLSGRSFDEVNFWHPSPKPPFTKAPIGMPFLFKLKKPHHAIAGGGYFVAHSTLPTTLAWEVFGEKNGAATLEELESLLEPLSASKSVTREIGCTVLSDPFFYPREAWLENPPGWSGNIVRGKMYDSAEPDGSMIWTFVQPNLVAAASGVVRDGLPRYGDAIFVRPRLGQSSFRVLVTDAYKRRCAMTGERTLVALEAAHILPYSNEGQHEIRNGLLLRADFHRLFDVGLVGVTPEYRIKVSPRIREAWFNGQVYYRLNDQPLAVLPDNPAERPDRDLLQWHIVNRFQQ